MKTKHQQRGFSLIESLVGFLVLSLSLAGAVLMQSWLRQNGDLARQRTEAVRWAQQEIEQLRGFTDTTAFRGMANRNVDSSGTHTTFRLDRALSNSEDGWLTSSHIAVTWQNRGGELQTIALMSSVAGVAPVYSAALSLPSQDRVFAVRAQQPLGTIRLHDGRSVLRPTPGSTMAWVVNSATGEVVSQCALPVLSRPVTAEDLTQCNVVTGQLIRGFIRFSLNATPDPVNANDVPLPLSVQADATRCEVDTSHATGDGERYLSYVCLVPTNNTQPPQLSIVPTGWSFGITAAQHKACRYVSPDGTTTALHNFLIIRGDLACPRAQAQHNGSAVATLQHQP